MFIGTQPITFLSLSLFLRRNRNRVCVRNHVETCTAWQRIIFSWQFSKSSRKFHLLPGPSRRQAPVIKCNAFLCFQSYIVRDISLTEIYRWLVTFIEILSAILKSTSGGVKRKIIAFWTTRFPAFMSKNLRVNIWRDKFTSDRLRVNLPSWNLSRK